MTGRTNEAAVLVSPRRYGKNLALIAQFNEMCPVGSPVLYWPGDRSDEGRKSVTRSEAWLLGGHTPVVMVEGYAGGIALSHVMGYTPAHPNPEPPTGDGGREGVGRRG